MTNREWLNSLSSEELAKNVLMQNTCELCLNYNEKRPNFCRGKDSDDCLKGFVEWLNTERIEPMPIKLEV